VLVRVVRGKNSSKIFKIFSFSVKQNDTFDAYIGGGRNMKKKHFVLKELGKVALNFGNITFASLVIGSILTGDYYKLAMFWAGIGVTLLFIILGLVFLVAEGGE
jgi:putative Mn2+ efflux pump MntP